MCCANNPCTNNTTISIFYYAIHNCSDDKPNNLNVNQINDQLHSDHIHTHIKSGDVKICVTLIDIELTTDCTYRK